MSCYVSMMMIDCYLIMNNINSNSYGIISTQQRYTFKHGIKLNNDLTLNEKLFGKEGVTDVETVEEIRKALLHVEKTVGKSGTSGIDLEEIPGEFVFHYESDGSIAAVDIFNRACEELKTRFDSIGEQLKIALT